MSGRRRCALLWVAVAISSFAGSGLVHAEPADPHIARARAHLDGLALDLAQAELELALHAGDSDRARLIEIHRLLGIVLAGLDRPELAVDQFRHVLALDPRADLPAELGPKIVQPFTDARASMQGRGPLMVRLSAHRPGDPALVVVVESDPLDMVKQARATFVADSGGESVVIGPGAPRISLAIPHGAARARIAIFDAHGNRLAELDAAVSRPGTGGDQGSPRPSESPRWIARWTVWTGVAVGFAAAGGGLALAVRSTRSELDDLEQTGSPSFTRVEELNDRGRRLTLLTNIAFGAAGVAAVVSAVLFVRQPATSARVTIAPASNGAVVTLSGGF